MNPATFSLEEQKQLLECLAAVERLPLFGTDQFGDVFGLSKDDFKTVKASFPNWDFYDEGSGDTDHSRIALHNALAWLMGGTDEERSLMRSGISFDEESMTALHKKFQAI